MKLKQVFIFTLKEETLELEHNQDKYTFFSIFKYLKFLSMLSVSSLYKFFIFQYIIFLRDHNGNNAVQLFCAIPVVIDFLIVLRNSLTIL